MLGLFGVDGGWYVWFLGDVMTRGDFFGRVV